MYKNLCLLYVDCVCDEHESEHPNQDFESIGPIANHKNIAMTTIRSKAPKLRSSSAPSSW